MDAYPPVIYRELFGVDAGQVATGDIRDTTIVARLTGEADFVVHAMPPPWPTWPPAHGSPRTLSTAT